ncbi:hypothetical protein ACFY1L_13105 [Streptomyces sp. NPDC001663]|uniref:hypothetical protein n=1 Tax=Streptomyces sp. NPDC001663 TaxID=3364597 RepID=UPI0036820C0C
MNVRSKGISVVLACAMTGVVGGIGANTASAAPAVTNVQTRAGADEICAVIGIGSGAAGLTKALAKGASWVGIGASIGCYLYTKAKEQTPAAKRAAMIKAYNEYQSKTDLKKLDALGYYCRKKSSGGGGGGDFANVTANTVTPKAGWRDIKMKGVVYECTAEGD